MFSHLSAWHATVCVLDPYRAGTPTFSLHLGGLRDGQCAVRTAPSPVGNLQGLLNPLRGGSQAGISLCPWSLGSWCGCDGL